MPDTCIRFGELGARVMIEDQEVRHYDMHVDPVKKEASCWIASEAGKAFKVVWLESDIEHTLKGKLYLDGHYAGSRRRLLGSANPIIYQYINISDSSCAPFLFSPLVVTDDDTYLDASSSHSIGEIKLDIFRTTVPDASVSAKQHQQVYLPLPLSQKVHERSKKAIAHRVNYGTEIPRPGVTKPRKTKSSTTKTWVKTDSTKCIEKLVTFIFKYRPLEMLRANDIVPRNFELLERQETLDTPPASEMSSGKREQRYKVEKEVEFESDDDEDSMREKALLAEVQRCQAEVERIRKERHLKDSERPKKKLKKEYKPLFIHGEVIDLT